jgi:hypothetical protein
MNTIDASKVKKDDIMAFIYWAKVENVIAGGESLLLKDLDHGNTFSVQGKDLVKRAFSADQYENTFKVTKTEAAEKLIASHNRPLTVCFVKQDGKERTMRCRLVKHEALLGRSMVEDLEATDDKHRIKQVDHRTIEYLIVDGTKYEVK